MSALFNKQGTIEPGPTSLFPNFVGAGVTAVVSLTVDGGSEEFTVGDVVTDDGVGAGEGTIFAILNSSGVWDGVTSSGTAVLVLTDVTGTFTNDAGITGAISGVAVADGTGTAGNLNNDPTDVKGKGIESVVSSDTVDALGLYTITLTTQYAGLLGMKFCYLDADTTDDWQATIVSESVATDRQVVVQVFKSGTASPSATDEKLYFELVLATSSMRPLSY